MATSERKGEYGYDGSFHTISAGTQLAGVGAVSAALFATDASAHAALISSGIYELLWDVAKSDIPIA